MAGMRPRISPAAQKLIRKFGGKVLSVAREFARVECWKQSPTARVIEDTWFTGQIMDHPSDPDYWIQAGATWISWISDRDNVTSHDFNWKKFMERGRTRYYARLARVLHENHAQLIAELRLEISRVGPLEEYLVKVSPQTWTRIQDGRMKYWNRPQGKVKIKMRANA